jgi:exopolysaccharide biosynthesis polyprenyl glycosylphosphotransferase
VAHSFFHFGTHSSLAANNTTFCSSESADAYRNERSEVTRPTRKEVLPNLFTLCGSDFHKHSRASYVVKRVLDIVGSLFGMIFYSPIMLLAALAIKVTSRGPVIFKQVRLGYLGSPFVCYKFRSMHDDVTSCPHRDYIQRFIRGDCSEQDQGDRRKPFFKMRQDSRITPIGRFLRKMSIDELPQIYNVLRGDMSLVGPRPPLPYEVESYSTWHLRRLSVKPGLTGLWQVEGRSSVSFDDSVRLDLQYAENWSVLLDLKIIMKTFKVVLLGIGAA